MKILWLRERLSIIKWSNWLALESAIFLKTSAESYGGDAQSQQCGLFSQADLANAASVYPTFQNNQH